MRAESTTDPAPTDLETAIPARPRPGHELIEELTRDARPAEISESAKTKLFVEWEKSLKNLEQAKVFLRDCTKHHRECTERLVSKLGRGDLRYKDVLYSVSAKKGTVFLRRQKRKPK